MRNVGLPREDLWRTVSLSKFGGEEVTMQAQADIQEGMTVHSADGEKLGKVVSCGADTFTIEKGLFFPKEYEATYDAVREIHEGDIVLNLSKDELISGRTEPERMETGERFESAREGAVGATGIKEV